MTIHELIVSSRTIRQYRPKPVDRAILERLVDAGRLAPSAANMQPLEFYVVDDPALRAAVFPCLKWAAYIQPAGNPGPGQEPTAYVFVLVNIKIREKMYEYDVGAAVENICLAALGEGIGSCWLISIDRPKIAEALGIPEGYRIDSVVALGYPAETSIVEEFKDSLRYWKDKAGGFHVPKRKRADVIHVNRF
ncbi:MAG: nitroreductase family protein [Candidatus Aminicenantales bacterium]